MTTFPLRNVLYKSELLGRLAKWAVEVSEFDIEYNPRTAIKSLVLADFVADCSLELMPLSAKETVLVSGTASVVWTLFTNRISNIKWSSLGVVLITPLGETLRQAIRIVPLTNNKAEYEALVAGLELVRGLGSEVIEIKCDSQLVVNQGGNVEADALANLGLSIKMKGYDSNAVVQLLHSVWDVDDYCEVNSTSLIWDLRNEFIEYLRHGKFLEDPKHPGYCGPRQLVIVLLTNNYTRGSKVTKFLEGLKIKRIASSPYHPSANGQAESTKKVIIQHLKKKLEDAKCKWPDELSGVLWAYRTTTRSSTGETPFSLVYDSEALIPVEAWEPNLRFFRANKETNNEVLLVKLDFLEEHRNLVYVRMVAQKQTVERYYNRRVNLRYFKVRNLVLRKVTQSTREVNAGKLGPTWEGPYRVSSITGKGSYELKNQDGVKLPSNWNVTHLKGISAEDPCWY
ncbi:uncharacterized protein [Nicotiana tomentosiformis]|uniref:uncharacterized protein n=1 Tax=Nicotiana tomentosiformis TaxID=4098 RepID=UPI00051ACCCA|nr:uncharacterized protein LOC117280398 [Nicotiana tomentosiformis]